MELILLLILYVFGSGLAAPAEDFTGEDPLADELSTSYPNLKSIESISLSACPNGHFIVIPEDTTKYFKCEYGITVVKSCPVGMRFYTDRCEYPPPIPEEIPRNKTAPAMKNHNNKKLICYFKNDAWRRSGVGEFLPENIDISLCTHIVYAFAWLDDKELVMKPANIFSDIQQNLYKRVTSLKKHGLKILISLGGWDESNEEKYHRLINTPIARLKFIQHAMDFMEQYDFDGLNLHWIFPVCLQTNCFGGSTYDKFSFGTFVKELSIEFRRKGFLLSSVASSNVDIIDAAFDVPTLSEYLDWIEVLNYDEHTFRDKKTGHLAPIYHYHFSKDMKFSANVSLNYWIKKGADPGKLVMGVATHGRTFTLQEPSDRISFQSDAPSPGLPGPYTREKGLLAFYEICEILREDKYRIVRDKGRSIGPIAVFEDQWIGFDDVTTMYGKAYLILNLNIAGAMIWSLDMDDFRGICGCGTYPLLTALSTGLLIKPPKEDCTYFL